jgi:transcriptional regulator with XRE-family HTH domain
MAEFEFTYIASTSDLEAPDLEDRFFEAGCDDATLFVTKGMLAVCFIREEKNFAHAVCSALRDIEKTDVKVERFEPDFLVSQSEIAKRADLSRAAVSLYVKGERGNGFPNPYARILSDSPLWDWVEVAQWLHRSGQVPLQVAVDAEISRTINRHFLKQGGTTYAQDQLIRSLELVSE